MGQDEARQTAHADLQQVLGVETRRFADRLKKMFSTEITRNAVTFKKLVLRLVRRALPPRPGHRNDPQIDAAIQLLQQGKTVRDVLQMQIPDFEKMDSYARILSDRGLRKSLGARGIRFRKGKTIWTKQNKNSRVSQSSPNTPKESKPLTPVG